MNQIWIVFQKEWRDMLRDKRTIGAAFAYSLFGPLLIGVLLHGLAADKNDTESLTVAISSVQAAPGIVSYLEQQDYTVVEHTGTDAALSNMMPADMMPEEGVDVLIVPEKEYAARRAAGRTATLYLYGDEGKQKQRLAMSVVRAEIYQYSNSIANGRLIARGVAPEVTSPIMAERRDLSSSGAVGKSIGHMLLIFFVMAPFFASMSVSIDTTAGERERGSLNVLLAQPISSLRLTVGKWAMAASFGMIGTALTIIVGTVVLSRSPLADLDIRLVLDWSVVAFGFLLMVPMILFVAALQMLASLYAKSYKEGQTYLTMLSFVPAIIGFMGSFGGDIPDAVKNLPIFAELENFGFLLQHGTISAGSVMIPVLLGLALTGLCVWLTARRFDNERLLGG